MSSPSRVTPGQLTLRAESAADLMTTGLVSLQQNATLCEAAAFLIEKEISAAPVIDDAGRPVGVLSHTDIVRHELGQTAEDSAAEDFYRIVDPFRPAAFRRSLDRKNPGDIRVKDIMSPVVLSVSPDDAALAVVSELLALKVHRLFVVDRSGTLIGVISTFDVLRKLRK